MMLFQVMVLVVEEEVLIVKIVGVEVLIWVLKMMEEVVIL